MRVLGRGYGSALSGCERPRRAGAWRAGRAGLRRARAAPVSDARGPRRSPTRAGRAGRPEFRGGSRARPEPRHGFTAAFRPSGRGASARVAGSRKRDLESCTKIVLGTVSERPKVQLSKSCVGVEPTVGSNPTGSAVGLVTNLKHFVCESQPKTKSPRYFGGFFVSLAAIEAHTRSRRAPVGSDVGLNDKSRAFGRGGRTCHSGSENELSDLYVLRGGSSSWARTEGSLYRQRA